MVERIPLKELDPMRIAAEGTRYGLGFSFMCFLHDNCRLTVPFLYPDDGGMPVNAPELFEHQGGTFDEFSVHPNIAHGGAMLVIHLGVVYGFWLE